MRRVQIPNLKDDMEVEVLEDFAPSIGDDTSYSKGTRAVVSEVFKNGS